MRLQNVALSATVAVATSLSASAAVAGGSVTATASVSVIVLAPVTITATQGLDFGAVTRPANANTNTIVLDAASSSVTLTGSGDGARAAGAVSAAKFNLVGPAGETYSTTQSLTFAQPGLMRVAVSAPIAGNGSLGVIPASGTQELRFGGAFDLSAATPVQSYSGALTIIVNYN